MNALASAVSVCALSLLTRTPSLATGGLLTSGEDMVKFMQLLNRVDVAAHTTPQQILDGKSIREWLTEPVFHNPTVVQPDTLVDDGTMPPW